MVSIFMKQKLSTTQLLVRNTKRCNESDPVMFIFTVHCIHTAMYLSNKLEKINSARVESFTCQTSVDTV